MGLLVGLTAKPWPVWSPFSVTHPASVAPIGEKNGCYHEPQDPDPPSSQGTILSVDMGGLAPTPYLGDHNTKRDNAATTNTLIAGTVSSHSGPQCGSPREPGPSFNLCPAGMN